MVAKVRCLPAAEFLGHLRKVISQPDPMGLKEKGPRQVAGCGDGDVSEPHQSVEHRVDGFNHPGIREIGLFNRQKSLHFGI